jgi:Cu(I)/Ag(I) efflux system membrane fusion protein
MKKFFLFVSIIATFLNLPFVFADEFSAADTNKDGVISKEEFNAYLSVGAVTLPPALVQSLSDAATALAKDDLAGYKKHLPAILESVKQTTGAVRATLLPLSERLVPGTDLKTARKPFEPFSNAAANFVLAQPASSRQAKVFQCPMSPVLGVGRWIQKDNPKLQNPFFGSQMLTCGNELK